MTHALRRRSRRRRSRAALVLAVLASASCFGGRLPPLELYRLAPSDSTVAETPPESTRAVITPGSAAIAPGSLAIAPGAVAIAPYETPGVYGDRGIVFRIGDEKYGVYPSREWAMPVSTMLGLLTEDVLRRAPVSDRPALFDPPSYRTHQYVWRAIVRELEEVDRGREVFAAVHFGARLVRAADDSVLWSGSARAERRVPEGSMPAIVRTLSALSREVIGRLAGEARASLARSAASAARP